MAYYTSKDRNYLNGLWKQLGINANDETPKLIEAYVELASIREISMHLDKLRETYAKHP